MEIKLAQFFAFDSRRLKLKSEWKMRFTVIEFNFRFDAFVDFTLALKINPMDNIL